MSKDVEIVMTLAKMLHEENKAIAQMMCHGEEKWTITEAFNRFWEETEKIISEVDDEN